MTNAEARFNKSLRPRKPEGSLGRTAQDGHLDSHTAPDYVGEIRMIYSFRPLPLMKGCMWMTYHLTVHTIMTGERERSREAHSSGVV